MKYKIYCLFLFMGLLIMTGCTRIFDSAGYVTALMDALYKGDYSSYAEFTGLSTAEVSQYRSQWLSNATDSFITAMGVGTPSDAMRDRTTELLKKIYANAKYEVSAKEDGTIQLIIRPIDLITDNYDILQTYVEEFNEKNAAFAFASLNEQEFYDTYLDGILTILESHLAELSHEDPVCLNISIYQDDEGLYTLDSGTLADIQRHILQWPENGQQIPESADESEIKGTENIAESKENAGTVGN